MTTRLLALVASLSILVAAPVPAQAAARIPIERYQFTIDVGVLDVGLSYAERLGGGPLAFGAGVWGAWEPRETFDRAFLEARGVDLFVRYQKIRGFQAEVGPSFLRYATADDCADCSATFLGLRVAALAGGRHVLFGPTVRYGVVTGRSTPTETGFVYGMQVRFFLDWATNRTH